MNDTEVKPVVFGNCKACSTKIYRTDKRKISGKDFYHLACFPLTGIAETGNDIKAIADILSRHLNQSPSLDVKAIEKIVIDKVTEYLPKLQRIEVKNGTVIKEMNGVHKQFKTLLYLIGKGHHVYIHGVPGSGKTTAARHCAIALNREYGYSALVNQTPKSELFGYMDANGIYRPTVFYRIYKEGGVMLIDELDNASASLLTALNGALENGHCAFPCGVVERHKDFVLIGTGNTSGRGANPAFPERRPFDQAFAERFTYMEFEYDTDMEKTVCLSINPAALSWFSYIQKLREYCLKNHPRVIVTPRATFKDSDYLLDDVLSVEDIANNVIFKGIDSDTVYSINKAIPLPKR